MDEGNTPILTNKKYDIARRLVTYWLPALGTFYAVFGPLWELPYVEQVVGTILALATLLGALLGVSRSQFEKSDAKFDGEIAVDPDTQRLQVNFHDAPDGKSQVLLKVNEQPRA